MIINELINLNWQYIFEFDFTSQLRWIRQKKNIFVIFTGIAPIVLKNNCASCNTIERGIINITTKYMEQRFPIEWKRILIKYTWISFKILRDNENYMQTTCITNAMHFTWICPFLEFFVHIKIIVISCTRYCYSKLYFHNIF